MPQAPRVLLERHPKGIAYPYSTSIAVPSPSIFGGAAAWAVGAVSFTTQTIKVPILSADVPADVAFAAPFQSFPSFTLDKTSQAVIIASCFPITQPSDATTIIGTPALTIQFGKGNAIIGSGGAIFMLHPSGAYSGATINVVARFLSPTGTAAVQSIQFAVQAMLVGQPGGTT